MGIEDMTAQELRELAARKEAAQLHLGHLPEEDRARPGKKRAPLEPWERVVEVGGVPFTVDMRPFRSREFMRRALSISDETPAEEKLDLFDFLFAPVEKQILAEVEREIGYEDYDRYYEICAALFEAVQAKN